jgi:protease-4
MLDPFSPADPRSTERAKAMVDNIHTQFIEAVRNGRGDRLKETDDMFSGMIWTGEQALELGLIDGLLSPAQVASKMFDSEEIIDYTRRGSVLDQLGKRFGVQIRSWLTSILSGADLSLQL